MRVTGPQTAINPADTHFIVSLTNWENLEQVAELLITAGRGMSEL